jgi:hypothetical protein
MLPVPFIGPMGHGQGKPEVGREARRPVPPPFYACLTTRPFWRFTLLSHLNLAVRSILTGSVARGPKMTFWETSPWLSARARDSGAIRTVYIYDMGTNRQLGFVNAMALARIWRRQTCTCQQRGTRQLDRSRPQTSVWSVIQARCVEKLVNAGRPDRIW